MPSVEGLQYRVIHGYRRAFIKVGSGPALLLIHGIGDNADTWDHVLPKLARRYTVIAPELTYGVVRLMHRLGTDLGRDADDVVRVIDALPSETSRAAFVRTLRTVVDGRGQVVTMLDRAYLAEGVPLLLIWGGRDAVIPVAHGQIAQDALPGSRLEILEDAGHFPHRSDPDRFVALLELFIQDTEPCVFDIDRWRTLLRRRRPIEDHAHAPMPAGLFETSTVRRLMRRNGS